MCLFCCLGVFKSRSGLKTGLIFAAAIVYTVLWFAGSLGWWIYALVVIGNGNGAPMPSL